MSRLRRKLTRTIEQRTSPVWFRLSLSRTHHTYLCTSLLCVLFSQNLHFLCESSHAPPNTAIHSALQTLFPPDLVQLDQIRTFHPQDHQLSCFCTLSEAASSQHISSLSTLQQSTIFNTHQHFLPVSSTFLNLAPLRTSNFFPARFSPAGPNSNIPSTRPSALLSLQSL